MILTRTPSSSDQTHTAAVAERGRPAILIVDDEPVLVDEISEYLEADGYAVSQACDGHAALAQYHSEPSGHFAVVLTDLRMPGISGFALARAILARTTDAKATEVIVMTGHGSPSIRAEAPDGLYAIVPKPMRLSRLAEVVRQALDAALVRRAAAAPESMARIRPTGM